jgi:LuxR family transcriptional regulator of csgAB operon
MTVFQIDKTARIHIIGTLQLQNELFANALANATGFPCTCTSHKNLPYLADENSGINTVILWDCVYAEQNSIWEKINRDLNQDDFLFVLFNVSPEQKIETQAVKRGIRGIFYRDDALSAYKKGIQAILQGQLWISRVVLEKSLAEIGKQNEESSDGKETFLTFREREVLFMIAAGLSKDDIADDLGISPHTVKTHTHNIYQKINVKSRIKAALWATKNLEYRPRAGREARKADFA